MAGGKEPATGNEETKAEQDGEFQKGMQAIKAKDWAEVPPRPRAPCIRTSPAVCTPSDHCAGGQASNVLSVVLERFVNEYGELAPECADVYMQVPRAASRTSPPCLPRLMTLRLKQSALKRMTRGRGREEGALPAAAELAH